MHRFLLAPCLAVLSLGPARPHAQAYTYNPTTATEDWSTGIHWSATPVSGPDTVLIFNPAGGTFLGAVTNTNTNNLGSLQLNQLLLAGFGPVDELLPVVININGGTLDFNNSTAPGAPFIGLYAFNGAGSSTVTYNVNSAIVLTNNSSITGNGDATFNLKGAISGSGVLTKTGSSVVTLSGANTSTGAITVSEGTLALGASNALGSGALSVNGTGVLAMGGNSDSVGVVTVDDSGSLTGSGTLTSTASFAMNSGSASVVLAGAGIGLIKSSTGTMILSGANTYTGTTMINNGTLNLGSALALGGGGTVMFGGGTLQYSAVSAGVDLSSRILNSTANAIRIDLNAQTVTFNNPLSATNTAGLTLTGGGTLVLASASAYTGPTTLTSGTARTAVATNAFGSTSVINLSGTSVLALRADASTPFGNGITPYPVALTASGGTINVDRVASAAAGTTITLGAVSLPGAFALNTTGANGLSLSLGAITSSTPTNKTITNAIPAPGTLTIASYAETDASATLITFNGVGSTIVTGAISQNGANALTVTKSGSGTLTLSGSNNATGGVTLSAGKLNINTAAALGTGTFTWGGSAVLDNTSGTAMTLPGNNPVILSGSVGFSTTAGTVSNSLTFGTAPVSVSAGLTITMNGQGGLTFGGPLTYNSSNLASNITINGASAGAVTFNGIVLSAAGNTGGTTRQFLNGSSGSAIITGPISDGAVPGSSINFRGGTVTLLANSTVTGGVTLSSGRMNLNVPGALGGGAFSWTGGTLENTSGAPMTITNPTLTIGGNTTLIFSTTAGTTSNNITFTAATVNYGTTQTLSMTGTGALTFSGALTSTSANSNVTLTVDGATNGLVSFGGYVLSGTGSTGPRTQNLSGSGNIAITGPVSDGVSAGSIFRYSGTGQLTLAGNNLHTGLTSFSGGNSNAMLTISGNNSGATGGVNFTAGKLNLNSTTALGTGTFTVTGGTIDNTSGSEKVLTTNNAVTIGGSFAFGSSAGTISNNLTFGPGNVSLANSRVITLNGAGALAFGGPLISTAGNTNITLTVTNGASTAATTALSLGGFTLSGGSATTPRTNVITGTGRVNITGAISDGLVASNLTYSGTGKLTVSGNSSTYTGTTTLSGAGTLTLGHALALGAASAPLVLGNGVLDLATDTSVAAHNVTITGTTTIQSNKATPASAGITQTLGNLSIGVANTLHVTAGANVGSGTPRLAFGSVTAIGPATFNPTTADLSLASISGAEPIHLNGSSAASTVTGAITASTVNRNGTGTWNLDGAQNYTTLNASTGTTTNINGAFTGGTATVNANASAVVNFGSSQTLSALNIGAGAVVTLTTSPAFAEVAAVPEPGSAGLLIVGTLGLLGRRRRISK